MGTRADDLTGAVGGRQTRLRRTEALPPEGGGVGMTPLVCVGLRGPLADRPLTALPSDPPPPQAVVPSGLSPPGALPLPQKAYPSLSTSLSFPLGGCANGAPRPGRGGGCIRWGGGGGWLGPPLLPGSPCGPLRRRAEHFEA